MTDVTLLVSRSGCGLVLVSLLCCDYAKAWR